MSSVVWLSQDKHVDMQLVIPLQRLIKMIRFSIIDYSRLVSWTLQMFLIIVLSDLKK